MTLLNRFGVKSYTRDEDDQSRWLRNAARAAVGRLSFDRFLRGGSRDELEAMFDAASALQLKYNHNHDPATGRFTSAGGGASSAQMGHRSWFRTPAEGYRAAVGGSTIGFIKPTSGGYIDANGRYVPELFPPDPNAILDPADALAHYAGRSGDPMNYYLNNLDTSAVKLETFPAIRKMLDEGQPGIHLVSGATGILDTNEDFSARKLSPAATIGRLKVQTDGVLAITSDGRYDYRGSLTGLPEYYDFNPDKKRRLIPKISTAIGRRIPGVPFQILFVGSKPLSGSGHVRSRSGN